MTADVICPSNEYYKRELAELREYLRERLGNDYARLVEDIERSALALDTAVPSICPICVLPVACRAAGKCNAVKPIASPAIEVETFRTALLEIMYRSCSHSQSLNIARAAIGNKAHTGETRPVDWEAEYKKLAGVYTREGLEKFIADYWPGNVLANASASEKASEVLKDGCTCGTSCPIHD